MPDLAPKDHPRLAQLVTAYYEKFGRYVPARVLRLLDAAPTIQDSLATGVPLSETDRGSPRGCCLIGRAMPTKGPDGALIPEVIAMRFVPTRPESREAMKVLERDQRDLAVVSSLSQYVAFMSVVWRDGWVTEFEIQRNGCSDEEMAAFLDRFASRFANPATTIIH